MTNSFISDIVADDIWEYKLADGTARRSRVVVGRPRPAPDDSRGDFGCPVYFEDVTDGIRWVMGVGPVDALMNAMRFVSVHFYNFKEVRPLAGVPTLP
jgi:hypothetical protein